MKIGRMRETLKNRCIGFAALLVLLAFPATAVAQNKPASQSALTVSPAITEDVTPAGKQKTITVQLTNTTSFPLPISGTVKNFVPIEKLEDTSLQSKYDASKWFTIVDPDFILQPKQTRTITVHIDPPADAEPGGHYATIYFTPLIPESALTDSTTYLSAQVGTLAFLIVPGAITEKLAVTSFTTSSVHQSRTVDFSLKLKNTGTVHVAPNGTIEIKNWRGKTVASVPLKPGLVLPGTEKAITASWKAHAPIGKYTATARVTYGSSHTKAAPVSTAFWVIPWVLMTVVIALAATALFIFVKTRGRWRKAWRILRGHNT